MKSPKFRWNLGIALIAAAGVAMLAGVVDIVLCAFRLDHPYPAFAVAAAVIGLVLLLLGIRLTWKAEEDSLG